MKNPAGLLTVTSNRGAGVLSHILPNLRNKTCMQWRRGWLGLVVAVIAAAAPMAAAAPAPMAAAAAADAVAAAATH